LLLPLPIASPACEHGVITVRIGQVVPPVGGVVGDDPIRRAAAGWMVAAAHRASRPRTLAPIEPDARDVVVCIGHSFAAAVKDSAGEIKETLADVHRAGALLRRSAILLGHALKAIG